MRGIKANAKRNTRLFLVPAALLLCTFAALWLALFDEVKLLAAFAVALTEQGTQPVPRSQRPLYTTDAARTGATDTAGFDGGGANEASRESGATTDPAAVQYPYYGEIIGTVRVESAGIEAAVVQGDTEELLRDAAGHAFGSSLPGEEGLIVVSAHRNTFFKALGKAKPGDVIVFETYYGTYKYVLRETAIFGAKESGHLAETGKQELVLITCYPFDYVGNAPNRYAAYCDFVEGEPVRWKTE